MFYNKKIIKSFNLSILTMCLMFLGLISCYDDSSEEFQPPTGNINNIQPNTLFTTSTNPDDNLAIVFRSYSTDAVSYLWDFGDGSTSTEANPNYTYAVGGLYTVTLTTISSDGLTAEFSEDVSPIFVDFNTTSVDTQVTSADGQTTKILFKTSTRVSCICLFFIQIFLQIGVFGRLSGFYFSFFARILVSIFS
mgnify:CR=1 FL=1